MMRIYGIWDSAIESYAGMPFFQPTNAAAIRAIRGEANREGSQLNQQPDDYALHHLGTFDETSGRIDSNGPEVVIRVKDLLDSQNQS